MTELRLPWLELSIVIPLGGAAWLARMRNADRAQRGGIAFAVAALVCTMGAWIDFSLLGATEARDRWHMVAKVLGGKHLAIDLLTAPLLPLAALLCLMTAIATMGTKVRRFSFSLALISESILLATLSCKERWGIVVLLAIGTLPPLVELLSRGRSLRVYVLHMSCFIALLIGGQSLIDRADSNSTAWLLAVGMLTAAVLLRSGIVPVHCWMTDLFENATLGTALLFVTPMVGAYAAVRLVLPVASDGMLHAIALVSLATSVYAAAMAIVQREARRFFCYLFLSHSSLVLVGLEIATPIGLTGALCVWVSVGLALTGFGLTLRSLEARVGRLSLDKHLGLFEHTPILAAFFLVTGLASIGFPGTIGFVATELLVDGAVEAYPYVGLAVVVAAALNGIAVLQAFFQLFTGTRHVTTISLQCRFAEQFAVMTLTLLILGGGLLPQPGVMSRFHAAGQIEQSRRFHPTSVDDPPRNQHQAVDALAQSSGLETQNDR